VGLNPIPAVDPRDLRAVWELTKRAQAQVGPAQSASFGIDARLLASVCSPGANVLAVSTRGALLDSLAQQGLLAPPDAVAFDVAATFPIPRMDRFNPDDFIRQLDNGRSEPS
jgi:hypothetical protein